jgi:hypothetical protein
MGAQMVAQVLACWTDVSDRAFRVLVRMALTALDKPQNGHSAGIYRGGRDLLALSLRSDGSDETKYRAVKRAIAELTEVGAIEHIATGWAGQNAVYRLTLSRRKADTGINEEGGFSDPPFTDVTKGGKGGPNDPPEGGFSDPPMGGQSVPERGVPATPPRNQEEVIRELEEENGVGQIRSSHRSRATPPDEKTAPVIQLFQTSTDPPPPPPSPAWRSRRDRAADAINESSARIAARRAENQARLAAGDEP